MTFRYTEDRVINRSTEAHPGPWIGKQRVYQTKQDQKNNADWYHVVERVYDSHGIIVPESQFTMTSGLSGQRNWLMLADNEPVLYVKKVPMDS